MADPLYDIAHLLAAFVLMLSFAMLFQRRLTGVVGVSALQALVLAVAAAWQAHVQGSPQLAVAAALLLGLKVVMIPRALRRLIARFGIQRAVEPAFGVTRTMAAGVALVTLSVLLVVPVTGTVAALTREELALALSVVLLGLLCMISRRNAISQLVGFLSVENGLILAALAVPGMPLVVGMQMAFALMVAVILAGIRIFHIRERFDTPDAEAIALFRGGREEEAR